MNDIKIEINAILDVVSHERQQRIYDYAKSLKDGPPGNLCQCNHPIKVCKCDKEN